MSVRARSLKAMNPKLIYLSITAFGSQGPYGGRPGYDPILQAMSGAARGNLRYCKSVGICSVAISDYGSALIGASRVSQIEDAVGTLQNLAFTAEELQTINQILAGQTFTPH